MTKNKYSLVTLHSTREDGSMMNNRLPNTQAITQFLEKQGIQYASLHMMKQVHGNTVTQVTISQGKLHEACDALVTTVQDTYLGVVTADCIPLLFSDKKLQTVAVAHAGYKGLLSGIISNTIRSMVTAGVRHEDISVSIGPSIGKCCYSVPEERARAFAKLCETDTIFSQQNDTIHLDLHRVAQVLLQKEGLDAQQIQGLPECTNCNRDRYFSYRGDSNETFGTFLSVIGIQTL